MIRHMAKQTIIQITDDIDGTKDAQEVSFSFQGTEYKIDLAKKNLTVFEKALKPYIEAATKVSRGSTRSRRVAKPASTKAPGRNTAAIREWAKSAGIELSARGRIPNSVVEQYESAQSK